MFSTSPSASRDTPTKASTGPPSPVAARIGPAAGETAAVEAGALGLVVVVAVELGVGVELGVEVGGGLELVAGAMVMVSACELVAPVASVTSAVKAKVPAAVGIPLMTPAGLRVSPGGSDPDSNDQV